MVSLQSTLSLELIALEHTRWNRLEEFVQFLFCYQSDIWHNERAISTVDAGTTARRGPSNTLEMGGQAPLNPLGRTSLAIYSQGIR